MLEINEVTDDAALVALADEWRALVDRAPDATIFQSFEWQTAWWRHFGRGWLHFGEGKLWILTARDRGALVGIAPLYVSRYFYNRLRRVTFLGAGWSNYLDFIALPERLGECRGAFLDHLARHGSRWDLLYLAQLREEAPLAAEQAPARLRAALLHEDTSYFVRLPGSWDDYTARLGRTLRQNIGRRQRVIEREFTVDFTQVGGDEVDATMEELYELHRRRWAQEEVYHLYLAFSSAEERQFHKDVAIACAARGWLRLYRLRLDGKTAAILYALHFGDKAYALAGVHAPELGKYGLGTVLYARAIKDAIEAGATELELLRGEQDWKFQWDVSPRRCMRLIIGQPRPSSYVAFELNKLEQRVWEEIVRLGRDHKGDEGGAAAFWKRHPKALPLYAAARVVTAGPYARLAGLLQRVGVELPRRADGAQGAAGAPSETDERE